MLELLNEVKRVFRVWNQSRAVEALPTVHLTMSSKCVSGAQPVIVSRPVFLIGRDDVCDLRLGGTSVSRRHCALLLFGETVLIRDTASKNGTLVNGKSTGGEKELRDGDELRVGEWAFHVSIATRPELTKSTEACLALSAEEKQNRFTRNGGSEMSDRYSILEINSQDDEDPRQARQASRGERGGAAQPFFIVQERDLPETKAQQIPPEFPPDGNFRRAEQSE